MGSLSWCSLISVVRTLRNKHKIPRWKKHKKKTHTNTYTLTQNKNWRFFSREGIQFGRLLTEETVAFTAEMTGKEEKQMKQTWSLPFFFLFRFYHRNSEIVFEYSLGWRHVCARVFRGLGLTDRKFTNFNTLIFSFYSKMPDLEFRVTLKAPTLFLLNLGIRRLVSRNIMKCMIWFQPTKVLTALLWSDGCIILIL